MTTSILLSGFGGQGILFAGKQLAKTGMDENRQVSWLPSYGPEMRGGTANCSVIIADEEIGSPLVNFPDILMSFNLPSFEKFEPSVKEGGLLFADSSLITKTSKRDDIKAFYVPATALASDNNLTGMANVIMLGKLIRETNLFGYETFVHHLTKGIPESKAALIEKNQKAFDLGYRYDKA